MTLVELLATLAIVGMLTAAAMAVICQLGRSRQFVAPPETLNSLLPRIAECIRPDILHARQYRNTAAGFEIVGLSSIEPVSMRRCHVPATVFYEVVTLDGVPWLIRKELSPGEPARRELLCSGVAAISLFDPAADPDEINTGQYLQAPPALVADIVIAGGNDSDTAHQLRFRRQ